MNNAFVPVSVVIPCFNCAETIARAIDSVYNQTARPNQVIVVDDNSTDQTLSELIRIQDLYGYEWITILPLRINCGASHARNVGWEATRDDNKYVAFLDSDDEWCHSKIEIQYAFMVNNIECSISGHAAILVHPDSARFTGLQLRYDKIDVKKISFNRLMYSNPFVTPSFMVKRDIDIRFDSSKRYAEDYLFLLMVASEGMKVYCILNPLVVVYKEYGITGVSRNLLKMRIGDLTNYLTLWHMKKIGVIRLLFMLFFSSFKFLIQCLIGARYQVKITNWLNKSQIIV